MPAAAPQNVLTYDWRLSVGNLEAEHQVFTRMRATIEAQHASSGKKVVVLAHSMGVNYFVNVFLPWVTQLDGKWVDKHVHSLILLGGPMMGVPRHWPWLSLVGGGSTCRSLVTDYLSAHK